MLENICTEPAARVHMDNQCLRKNTVKEWHEARQPNFSKIIHSNNSGGLLKSALTELKTVWKDRKITSKHRIQILRSIVTSAFLYACETWTLTAELERRIQTFEMRCYRKIFGISFRDRITNEDVRNWVRAAIGPHDDLLSIIKTRKLRWYGHVTRATGLANTIMQGTVPGGRRRGRPKKCWHDNIKEWTELPLAKTLRLAEDRDGWRKIIKTSVVPLQPPNG